MAERICVVCGKTFESKYSGAKYCGSECRTGARKVQCFEARLRYEASRLPSAKVTYSDKISEAVSEARKNGMSYGQWMAQNR